MKNMKNAKKVKGVSPEGKETHFANKAYIQAKKAKMNEIKNKPRVENLLRNTRARR